VQQNEVSWWYQLGLLLRRNFLNTVRLPQTSYVKLIVTIITAIFTIILFQNCDGTIQGVQNRNGALFFMTMTIAFNSIQNIILIFPDERPVFLREVNNNMYSVSAYFFGKVIAELPASILTPVIYGCIVYFSIGLSTVYAYKFPVYLGLLILIYSASGSYALIISTLFADKQLAVTLTPILIIPFMLFAGFFVNQDNIPIWLIEFQYLSFFKYGYQALMLNEYTDLKLECMDPPKGKYIPKCDPLGDFNSPQTLTESALALVGMYVGCYIFALISMKLLSRKYQ
jgi:ATP-binding cassette, subfamily G (WHITE), eye pigment precursor transporter